MKDGADELAWQLQAVGIKDFVREHRFHKTRRWRLDIGFLEQRLGVEVEGGVFANGRHSRGAGFTADCLKHSELAIAGWRLIRVTTAQVRDGLALELIERALRAH